MYFDPAFDAIFQSRVRYYKEGFGDQEDASKKGRIAEIDADEDLSLINETAQDQERIKDQDLFEVHGLDGDEVFVDVTTGENVEHDATVAEKAKGVTIQEPSEFRTTSLSQPPQAKDKDKGIMVEPEKPLKKKDQIALDVEVARKLKAKMKAEMDKEKRIAREKNEANIGVIEEWDDVQATIDADKQLAEQLQDQEREQLSIKERSKLLAELIESRRKYFAAKRAEEIRNKPPTKAQQKSLIDCEGKLKENLSRSTEGSSKRAGEELQQESAKKQKLDEQVQAKVVDDDITELKRCLEIVLEDDNDVTIKATPLSSKSPTIVDYKIYREEKKNYIKIIRADGNSQNYLTFGTMFKNFNRVDLEVLRSIVKERFKKTNPVDDMDNLLFQTLKTMFDVKDII
nr:hypothetical protein [Tanacetum cinerariifolium]